MKTLIKRFKSLTRKDKRNLAGGVSAIVWPVVFFTPFGFWWGIGASMAGVALVAIVLYLCDRKEGYRADWINRLLVILPGIVYWILACLIYSLH